jgi:hypothetical protein
LHELDEAIPIVVNFFEYDHCIISFSLQNHKNSDIKFDYVFSLWIIAISFSPIFSCDDIIEFFETVYSRLLASISHVLAYKQIWLEGINVGGVSGERAVWGCAYLRASLYFPALNKG